MESNNDGTAKPFDAAHGSAVCPICGHIQPSGTFKTHPLEKPPLKRFRVQSERDGSTLNHGDYDTLEMARAGACGSDAVILTREPNADISDLPNNQKDKYAK